MQEGAFRTTLVIQQSTCKQPDESISSPFSPEVSTYGILFPACVYGIERGKLIYSTSLSAVMMVNDYDASDVWYHVAEKFMYARVGAGDLSGFRCFEDECNNVLNHVRSARKYHYLLLCPPLLLLPPPTSSSR